MLLIKYPSIHYLLEKMLPRFPPSIPEIAAEVEAAAAAAAEDVEDVERDAELTLPLLLLPLPLLLFELLKLSKKSPCELSPPPPSCRKGWFVKAVDDRHRIFQSLRIQHGCHISNQNAVNVSICV